MAGETTSEISCQISREASFESVEAAWRLLEQEPENDSPFLSYDWMTSWWEVFGEGRVLWLLSVRSGTAVVVLAPLMLSRRWSSRLIEIVGTGRSDHPGFLVKEGFEECVEKVFEYLYHRCGDWDMLSFTDITPEMAARFEGQSGPGWVREVLKRDESPYVRITGDWEGFLSSKSPKHRKNIRRLIKTVEENPKINVQCIRTYHPSLLRDLQAVEKNSWKSRRGNLRMSGRGFDFFNKVMGRFAERGRLEVWQLIRENRLLAYLINFCGGGKLYYYNGAYDEEAARGLNFSAGSALTANAIRDACTRGFHEYDFLRGKESYKLLWTRETRPLFHVVYWQRSATRSRMAWILLKTRWFLRRSALVVKLRQKILAAMTALGRTGRE